MLREIKTKHLRPRLLGISVNSTTPTFTAGRADLSTVTRAGTGDITVTYRTAFRRNAVVVGCAGAGVADGGYVAVNSTASNTGQQLLSLNGGAGAADGVSDYLFLGYDSNATDLVLSQGLRSGIKNCALIGMKIVGATGALSIGLKDASCVRNSTGNYTLTLRRGFGETPIVVACAENSAEAMVLVASKSASTINITAFDFDAAAADPTAIHVFVFGTFSAQETGRSYSPVFTTQRKPRLIATRVSYSGGTPTANINSNEISSITDNGTGDATLNLARPFKRAPIVVATAVTTSSATVVSASASAVRIFVGNSGGSGVDATFNVIMLGFDDASEY